ncbi:hypothetical protein P7K49_025865 [Saguinus oedipus]|uniref:Uncharacterized protein n=1 Tax=Saguinus oedipus TaxID=9490 RepID=A0ABQ9UIY1_SAGOE|nr:hypothetical protein P7K49_025865 [Saguinus oedipus]
MVRAPTPRPAANGRHRWVGIILTYAEDFRGLLSTSAGVWAPLDRPNKVVPLPVAPTGSKGPEEDSPSVGRTSSVASLRVSEKPCSEVMLSQDPPEELA